MNTPHVFHGMRADVTVPALSSALESVFGWRPISLYVSAYILPGITIEIYCSGIVALLRRQVSSVVRTSVPGVFAMLTIFLTRTSSMPVSSMIPPNIIAIIVRAIELIMLTIPPDESSESSASTPVSLVFPFMPASSRTPNEDASPWKIIPMIPPAMMPSVIPGIAATFIATAMITTSGGMRSSGLMLKLAARPSLISVTADMSAVPPLLA